MGSASALKARTVAAKSGLSETSRDAPPLDPLLDALTLAGQFDSTAAANRRHVPRLRRCYVPAIPYSRHALFSAMLAGEPLLVTGFPAPVRAPLRGLAPAEAGKAILAWLAQRRSHQTYQVFAGPTGVKRYLRLDEIARKWRANRTRFGVTDLHIRHTAMEDVIDPAVLSGFNLLPESTTGAREREMFSFVISTRGQVTDSHSDDPDSSNYAFIGRKLWFAWDTYEGAARGLQDVERMPLARKAWFDLDTWLSLRSARWCIVNAGETLFLPAHLTHKVITLEPYLGVGGFFIALPNCLRLLAHWITRGPLWSKRDIAGERDELLAEIAQTVRGAVVGLRHAPRAQREQWGHDYLGRSATAFIRSRTADHMRTLWSDPRFRSVAETIPAPWPQACKRQPHGAEVAAWQP